jgi:hypothetical protein
MSEEYLLNDSDLASWVLAVTVEGKSRGTVLNYQESVRQYRCSQGDQWSAISVLAGWDSQAMIQRYGRTVVAERALAEARALMS